ncbi:efflux RND transporter periplasmic adaptor subunit [Parabacteroides sp. 52]|uniref:efflux RND transporter periplasmic adaptor subunit n=1 Tax=unclassified Parabacteroides TaxID=2649774 RepID=UPI0013D6ACAF|nr:MULTISPECIES: efflux RND transporter periplasmic adaptor subunit [unclassified Parabacteroides]MDH6534680.1 RND family efflux transporter MFP subunit [Parabacteroides sp. PM5-20]NDV56146.1 efflux RND transporter periplasmic adaptor subunit [Parabacteroides sp. 52]
MKYYNLLTILLLSGVMMACGGEKKGSEAEEAMETSLPEEKNQVTVMTLEETDFHHELISNGKLSAARYVDLRFESMEEIGMIYVKNGDRVGKGQKLASLSTFRLSNKLAVAKDALERAKLELQDVLIGQGYMLADSAKVPEETMRLVRTKSGYDQALSQYKLSQYELDKAVLTAPFDGIVANLFAKEQNTASTSDIFCTIIDPHSLEASFTVLESELPLIKKGDKVEVTPYAATDNKTEGRITEVNPVVDKDGMVKVKAAVTDKGNLFEGMNVRVSIQRSIGKQLVVPKSALVLRSGKQVIFTLVNDRAYWTYVQTGLENAGHYSVVEGLKAGDIVITSGNINLAHEAPVTVVGTQQ